MNTTIELFDALTYIDDLILEMGMENADRDDLAALQNSMAKALHDALFQAAAQNIEPETIDMVMEDMKEEGDGWFIITELMQTSPSAQMAMLDALDEFRKNTLATYNLMK